jgi:hypothetical protein
MNKHTPGPWQYVFEGGTTAFITEVDGSTIICIRTTENTTAHKNLAANVRLIAAAPELLEALEALLNYENLGAYERADVRQQARAAIAKATGSAA